MAEAERKGEDDPREAVKDRPALLKALERILVLIEEVEAMRRQTHSLEDTLRLLERTDPLLRAIRDFVAATTARGKACVGELFSRPFETAMTARSALMDDERLDAARANTRATKDEYREALRLDVIDDATDVIALSEKFETVEAHARRAAAYGTRAKARTMARTGVNKKAPRDSAVGDYRAGLNAVREAIQAAADGSSTDTLKSYERALRRKLVDEVGDSVAGTKRPHYERDERDAIALDLRMYEYSPARFRCAHCGKPGQLPPPTPSKKTTPLALESAADAVAAKIAAAQKKNSKTFDEQLRHRLSSSSSPQKPASSSSASSSSSSSSKRGLMRCSKCRLVWFCSRSCQAAGWRAHKDVCDGTRPIDVALSGDRAEDFEDFVSRRSDKISFQHAEPDGTVLTLFLEKGDRSRVFDSLSDRPVTIVRRPSPMPSPYPMEVDE